MSDIQTRKARLVGSTRHADIRFGGRRYNGGMTASDPTPELNEEEKARLFRAVKIWDAWRTSTPMVVEGVRFDLSCDVDKDVWHPLHNLGVYGRRVAFSGPELVFPWTPPEFRSLIGPENELIDVPVGASVVIGFVTTGTLNSPFAAFAQPERREAKRAHLFVIRPDGDVSTVKRPLVLLTEVATEAHLMLGDFAAARRSLYAEFERRTGLEDIESLLFEPLETWPKLSPNVPLIYRKALLALYEGHDDLEPDGYIAFGYLMAKAEAEADLLAFATRGREAAQSQAKASEERRLSSRQATEKLRIIARQIIARDPLISLSRCSRAVADALQGDPAWTFKTGPPWIARQIKELFEPHGPKGEYRPRRDLREVTTADR